MRRVPLTAVVVLGLVGGLLPAKGAPNNTDLPAGPSGTSDRPSETATNPDSQGSARPNLGPSTQGPQDAAAALVRAAAAYEYGDLNHVVEASRVITEGSLPATQQQLAQAFRLLGIGLYLTNRPLGAEAAFAQLLRNDPRARLDPTTTRPELVAFFESLRRQHLTQERSTRKVIWNFIPPGGQFQNEDNLKGWAILGVGLVAGVTTATSFALYKSWELPGDQSKHKETAETLKTVNIVSGAVLIAVYVYGVVDGLMGYRKPLDDTRPPLSLHFFPGGGGLGFTF